MQKLRFLLLVLAAGTFFSAHAQFTVTGTILDSSSREPLGAASVFCQNTTLGTTTNKQGEFSLNLKSGGYDLIISYTGYKTQTIRVSTDNNKMEILMVKEDKSLGEVVLKNSYEVTDGLAKYGDFFLQYFIGATPNAARCTIVNPEVLKFYFYKRTNRLKVLAAEPVKIANNALGYNLQYQLDSFVYYYNTNGSIYRGYCLYTEMDGSDSMKTVWAKARKQAYEGSKLHFMRSCYDSTLIQDGWIVDLLDEKDDKKFDKISNIYDTAYYNVYTNTVSVMGADSIMREVASGPPEVEIYFPRKISITYTKKRPEPEYLKKMGLSRNVQFLISYIDLRDAISILENGYYYDQKNWVNQGYWSWKNLADQLPYDYSPE
ncbi:MAG: carboxypeptidase-like regulatory domain-containing protein [Chitinophagaceae bacterium]